MTRQTIFTRVTLPPVLAALYDIHGNLPALEGVLADASGRRRPLAPGRRLRPPSPWPQETIGSLRELPNATWIRGNGERWLREPPLDRPDVMEATSSSRSDSEDERGWLYSLQAQAELDGVLYVHGSPLSDVDSFPPEPVTTTSGARRRPRPDDRLRPQPPAVPPARARTAPTSSIPGSVGMPLDGDVRAA